MSTRRSTLHRSLLALAGGLIVWTTTACAPSMMTPQSGPSGMPQAMPVPSSPPVLEDSFAVSSIPSGAVWNVFVQASDPEGDMDHLWIVVTQLGKRVITENLVLTGPDRRAFSGYFKVYPRGARFSPWENLRVEIRIRDRAGNLSARAEHETQMGFQTREMVPAKWASATRHSLGTILFDLEGEDADHHFGIRGR